MRRPYEVAQPFKALATARTNCSTRIALTSPNAGHSDSGAPLKLIRTARTSSSMETRPLVSQSPSQRVTGVGVDGGRVGEGGGAVGVGSEVSVTTAVPVGVRVARGVGDMVADVVALGDGDGESV